MQAAIIIGDSCTGFRITAFFHNTVRNPADGPTRKLISVKLRSGLHRRKAFKLFETPVYNEFLPDSLCPSHEYAKWVHAIKTQLDDDAGQLSRVLLVTFGEIRRRCDDTKKYRDRVRYSAVTRLYFATHSAIFGNYVITDASFITSAPCNAARLLNEACSVTIPCPFRDYGVTAV